MTTVVAAYYLIASKHSRLEYAKWIENFMQMPFESLIFVDRESHDYLSAKYPETERRRYSLLDFSEFTTSRWEWESELRKDLEVGIGHSPKLYQVWNEKPFLVQRAITMNPYNTTHFMWVDIGCFREQEQLPLFKDFPVTERFVNDKVTFLQVYPFLEKEKQKLVIDTRFQKLNRIGGTMFGGSIPALTRFAQLHQEILSTFKAKGLFAGKDQTLYNFAVLQEPALFHLLEPIPGETYDRWFHLHLHFSRSLRIALVGPGILSIPPPGWGAVEILVWDYAVLLRKRGHQVQIVNTSKPEEIVKQILEFKPHFVHVQYDDFAAVIPRFAASVPVVAITSHYGYLEQKDKWGGYDRVFRQFLSLPPNTYIFALSEGIRKVYLEHGIAPEKLLVTPNGANASLFRYTETPMYADRSLYLAKIDYRKRQANFQTIPSLYFAGNCIEPKFDLSSPRYLGEWKKETLYQNLTDYGNLALLSDGEADPLVVKEALIAGLGVVLSEVSTAGLDLSQPFITVLNEEQLKDLSLVEAALRKNREVSLGCRSQIREYGLRFDWERLVATYEEQVYRLL
jgi:glycosyltransferase involved in cell wall biosynthesis